jgi:hypothetical protein
VLSNATVHLLKNTKKYRNDQGLRLLVRIIQLTLKQSKFEEKSKKKSKNTQTSREIESERSRLRLNGTSSMFTTGMTSPTI